MSRNLKYECLEYRPCAEERSQRCELYNRGGRCGLPDREYCTEWLKANKVEVDTDLLGHVTLKSKREKRSQRSKASAKNQTTQMPTDMLRAQAENAPIVRNITDDLIRSFKELGAEVCIKGPNIKELWLVPSYTDRDRPEISAEHAATLAVILCAFPGAKVTAFEKSPGASAPTPPTPNPNKEVSP